jgi:uncharacterized protein (TIGR02302 family)
LVFAGLLIAAFVPLLRLALPTRKAALARIDRVSGLGHRPASVLADHLANEGNDPATRALWDLHRQRAESKLDRLHAGPPSPRLVDYDRLALRAGVVVALVASAFLAGPEKYPRVAAAFDWHDMGGHGSGFRLDAWIDPPPYTGQAPVLLNRIAVNSGKADKPLKVEAPVGSHVIIRASGGDVGIETRGALDTTIRPETKSENTQSAPAKTKPTKSSAADKSAGTSSNEMEQRLVLRGDAQLVLRHGNSLLGIYDISSIPDKPPQISLTDAPKPNARGSLTLSYSISDDYGVVEARADFSKPAINGKIAARSLVGPPRLDLTLPASQGGLGEAETTGDLSDHPWAGARVSLTLTARDEAGNEGKSEPAEIALPQKAFVKPMARVLVEQRRNLVLAPDDKTRVQTALEALMIAPEAFDVAPSIYLGLRVASERLQRAHGDADLVEVADYLWEMALRIENGDLSDAEKDLRAAEQQLREALQRNAPEEEIRRLTENLRAAMDKFLNELAEQQMRDRQGEDRDAENMPNSKRMVTPKQLQSMLDRMQEMARSGNVADAQKMLEQLQNILENLQVGKKRQRDPNAREMSRALDELDRMSKEQQDLRDETHRDAQRAKPQRRDPRQPWPNGPRNQPGQNGPQDENDEESDNADNENDSAGSGGKMAKDADLQQRQKALRDRLEQLQKRLKQAGQGETGLDDAQGAMKDAEEALDEGQEGRDKAVDAQGRALEAMRQGSQKLAERMQQGDGEGSEQADDEGEGESPGTARREDGGADPLGRPQRNGRLDQGARNGPIDGAAMQRAQRVLEELRRRLSDPARPREETDYLERLLRRY